jgi:DNA-binding response OmpR family regulator
MANKPPKIVVIDDSPASISLYERSAEPLTVDLESFQSPHAGLAYLKENPADLVFLDILMHDLDGLTLLKRLRESDRHKETSVVMVTSKDYAQDRSTARDLRALEFLIKPIRSQEIRDVICKYTQARTSDGTSQSE